jgi:serine/threonine-protein kinase
MWSFDFPWPATDTTGKGALQHDSHPPTPIIKYVPNINRTIAKTIMQCVESDAGKRPESAEAILKQLRSVTSDNQ